MVFLNRSEIRDERCKMRDVRCKILDVRKIVQMKFAEYINFGVIADEYLSIWKGVFGLRAETRQKTKKFLPKRLRKTIGIRAYCF